MSTDGGGHLDLDTLAELDEGLVADDRTAAVHAHLDDCADCRDRRAALRTTRALLSTLPGEPMPEAVSARVDAALAEAARTNPTIVPLERRRRRWIHHPTLPGLAAAFAAVALISAVAIGYVASRGNDHGGSSAGPAIGARPAPVLAANFPVVSTGRDYTKAGVPQLIARLLANVNGSGSPAPGAFGTAGSTAQQRPIDPQLARLYGSREALRACIGALTAGAAPQTPLAVDFARYNGRPAVVVVLPGLSAGNVDAWIVGPGCAGSAEDLLLYESVPRPSG